MPRIEGRYNFVKVWRPHGTPYANHRVTVLRDDYPYVEQAIEAAVSKAIIKFVEEFGRRPRLEHLVVEVVGATALIDVTVYDIPDDTKED